ncbi:hypothetical protein CYMTET_52076 [Cymbomonas tetramitiformis]|uniref:N-acetyltransferase domain-containing protein n=1 Tax=Cymbomonas tetramitiformis TaxID=36881 RepID=A0AAE0BJV5_9CHLO|nr:hypothetical protein CYMTET_52076 [Cymbomonas tetramitiformis]
MACACAALRVQSFYTPPVQGEDVFLLGDCADKAHARWFDQKRRSEESRALRQADLGMNVICLMATAPVQEVTATLQVGNVEWLKECRMSGERYAVGTLDVHIGPRLPGEQLVGNHPVLLSNPEVVDPRDLAARYNYSRMRGPAVTAGPGRRFDPRAIQWPSSHRDCERAYVFNLCVMPEVRRQGVASALLTKAKMQATERGVRELYIHVEVENKAAERLYSHLGFVFEKEETAEDAAKHKRPR